MREYITIENDFFEIFIPASIKDYGDELLKYINNKNQIISDGDIILDESIKYFSKGYDLK